MQPSFTICQSSIWNNESVLLNLPTLNSIFEKYKSGQSLTSSAFKPYSTDISSLNDSEQSAQNMGKARGSYRKYTLEEKELAVYEILNGLDVKQVSQKYGIPRRNLLRWRKNGCERKEGGGRPTDIQMEAILEDKIKKEQIKGEKEIRRMAIQISKSSNFKASKGWYSKFCRRYKIKTGESL